MQGLAGKIQIEKESFSTDLDGQIDISGLMTVSNMSLNFMANSENLNESINCAPSNDERAFSDFCIDGTEKDWLQDAMARTSGINIANNNNQKTSAGNFMDGIEAISDAREAQQEMITKFGHTFSVEALQEAAKDALSDFERLAIEKGWNQEEKETIHASLLVIQNPESTREDRVDALNDIESVDPEYAEEFASDAKEIHITKNENKTDKTSEASQIEIQAKNSFLAESSDNFELSTDKPDSVISATFKEEVDGVGANAKSFSLDEAPQIPITEKAPSPFTLDY